MDFRRTRIHAVFAALLAASGMLTFAAAAAQPAAQRNPERDRRAEVLRDRSTILTNAVPRTVRLPLRDENGVIRVVMTYTETGGKRGPVTLEDANGVKIGTLVGGSSMSFYSQDTDLFGFNKEITELRQRVTHLEAALKKP